MKKSHILILIVIVVLILDQWLKIHVKTTYNLNEGFNLLGWDKAQIQFIENKGMAFGIELGGSYGKLALSVFRLFMIGFLIYLINSLLKTKEAFGLLVCFSLILAGAIGNMIDSSIYGLIFSKSTFHGPVATFMPEGGGYAGFLHGNVVDMLHFPLIESRYPEWFPFWGGERFEFFRPIFNLADAAISTGVISILVFYRRFFKSEEKKSPPSDTKEEVIFS